MESKDETNNKGGSPIQLLDDAITFITKAKENDSPDWSAISRYFQQLASKCDELNTKVSIPQLGTFEKLLATIDTESQPQSQPNSNSTSTSATSQSPVNHRITVNNVQHKIYRATPNCARPTQRENVNFNNFEFDAKEQYTNSHDIHNNNDTTVITNGDGRGMASVSNGVSGLNSHSNDKMYAASTISIRKLQHYVSTMNHRIENVIDSEKRSKVFTFLFTHTLLGSFTTPTGAYLRFCGAIELLEKSFYGNECVDFISYDNKNVYLNFIKEKCDKYDCKVNYPLPLKSRMNRICIDYILKHRDGLNDLFNLGFIKKFQEFSDYKHKRDSNEYFSLYTQSNDTSVWTKAEKENNINNNNGNNNMNKYKWEMMDMLRNILFEIGLFYSFTVTMFKGDSYRESGTYAFQKLLDLELIDACIQVNGVSWYHLFEKGRVSNMPKRMLMYQHASDYSLFFDKLNKLPSKIHAYWYPEIMKDRMCTANDRLAEAIVENDFDVFKSILTGDGHGLYDNQFSVARVLRRIIECQGDRRRYLAFVIENDKKYWWKVVDYAMIWAYAARRSDYQTMKRLFDGNHTNTSEFNAQFTHRELWHGLINPTIFNISGNDTDRIHSSGDEEDASGQREQKQDAYDQSTSTSAEIVPFKFEYNATTDGKYSAINWCIQTKYLWFSDTVDTTVTSLCNDCEELHEYKTPTSRTIFPKHENEMNMRQVLLEQRNNKDNDNYKCFSLLLKADVLKKLSKNRNGVIFDCYNNYKSSFVECMINHNVCADYTAIVVNCTKYPKLWKIGSLERLLHHYGAEKRKFNILHEDVRKLFEDDGSNHRKMLNALHWCVNIGLKPDWIDDKIGSDSRRLIKQDGFNWIRVAAVYNEESVKAAFEMFRLILSCVKLSTKKINELVNCLMDDQSHIIDVCMSRANVYPQFVEYLIANNGIYGWKIDYNKTNVVQFACLIGNYRLLRMVLDSARELNINVNIGNCGILPPAPRRNAKNLYLLRSNRRTIFPEVEYNRNVSNDFKVTEWYEKTFNSLQINSPLYWCIDTDMRFITNTNNKHNTSGNNRSESQMDPNYVLGLTNHQREYLCLGYLRNGGYDDSCPCIEYPDSIATILYQYFDWTWGSYQCFKYLLTNFYCKKQMPIHSIIISKAAKQGKIKFLQLLYKLHNSNPLKTIENFRIHSIFQQLVHTAAYYCRADILRFLLSILDTDDQRFKGFDINSTEIGNQSMVVTDINNVNASKFTPLSACVNANPAGLHYDKTENFNCFKLLLQHPNINPNIIYSAQSLLLHCVDVVKFDFVKHLIENNDKLNQYNTCKWKIDLKATRDLRTIWSIVPYTKPNYRQRSRRRSDYISSEELLLNQHEKCQNCLHIAISQCKRYPEDSMKIVKYLLSKNIFTYKELENMGESLLCDCVIVGGKGDERYDSKPAVLNRYKAVTDMLKYLLTGDELISKQTGDFVLYPTQRLLDCCMEFRRIECLRFLLKEFKDNKLIIGNKSKIANFVSGFDLHYDGLKSDYPEFDRLCWNGDAKVLMANGEYKLCKDVKIGDKVTVFPGGDEDIATVVCTVMSNVDKSIEMCRLQDNGWITFEHPILVHKKFESECDDINSHDDDIDVVFDIDINQEMKANIKRMDSKCIEQYGLKWILPKNVKQTEMIYQNSVFNFILDGGHCICANNHWCCTLGHDIKGQVIQHELWGNYQNMTKYLKINSVTQYPNVVIDRTCK